MRDRIAFFADGHLVSGDVERIANTVRTLDRLGESCSVVCILGDLFEVWLGVKTAIPAVEAIGSALRRLRAGGVKTVYVEGNRDFEIGRGATAGMFDVVERQEMSIEFGGKSFHLSHGDLVNTRDRPYRTWRRFAKGVLAPVALRLLPDRTALRTAAWLETRLRSTNRAHKMHFPEEQCIEFARARVARGADYVLVGHFHRHVVLPIAADHRRGTFIALPFWHDEPKPIVFDRTGEVIADASAGGSQSD